MRSNDLRITGSFYEDVPVLRDHFLGRHIFILAVFMAFIFGIGTLVFSPGTEFRDDEGAAVSPRLFLYFLFAGSIVGALVVVALSVRHYLRTSQRKALIQQVFRRQGEILLDLKGVARVGGEMSGTVSIPVPHATSSMATFNLDECHAEISVDDHSASPTSYRELYEQCVWDPNCEQAYDTSGLHGEVSGASIGGTAHDSEIPIFASIPPDAPAADLTHRIFWL